jgi:hypothetical protein
MKALLLFIQVRSPFALLLLLGLLLDQAEGMLFY